MDYTHSHELLRDGRDRTSGSCRCSAAFVDRVVDLALAELGIPRQVLHYLNYPTFFDSAKARRELAGSGIEVPPISSYAAHLWDYWERTFSPGGAIMCCPGRCAARSC